MSQTFPRIHHSEIAKNVSKDVSIVGRLKGGVLELPENKSISLKNFTGSDSLLDKMVEVRGTLLDTQTLRCDSFSDFGREFGKLSFTRPRDVLSDTQGLERRGATAHPLT